MSESEEEQEIETEEVPVEFDQTDTAYYDSGAVEQYQVLERIEVISVRLVYEPCSEKTGLRGFRPGPAQILLRNYRRLLEARNFGFRKVRDCTIYVPHN